MLEFKIERDDLAILHGFAGYFSCVLYKEVTLSTEPSTHSPGMFSWFPMFLPLAAPLCLKKGEVVTLKAWRIVSADRLWYEWCLVRPGVTTIQNFNGSSFQISL